MWLRESWYVFKEKHTSHAEKTNIIKNAQTKTPSLLRWYDPTKKKQMQVYQVVSPCSPKEFDIPSLFFKSQTCCLSNSDSNNPTSGLFGRITTQTPKKTSKDSSVFFGDSFRWAMDPNALLGQATSGEVGGTNSWAFFWQNGMIIVGSRRRFS